MPRATKTGPVILAGWVISACVPATSTYLNLPVEPQGEADLELAVVEVSLDELDARMTDMAPQQLAFYNLGRDPIPHELRDTDGDGIPDVAVLVIPVPRAGTSVFAVSPGPRTDTPLPTGGIPGAVTVHYDRSYR